MWNPATDLGDCIGNNKVMTSSFVVKLPFSIASDDEQLEKDVMEFDQEKYDKVLDEFHEKVRLVFDSKASEKLTDETNEHFDSM